mmetsp:Transcript_91233/g.174998  ORF Transcript_91233/g.174998 Transcript_91233/m.174998 type:complete len:84 (-) Transcript_91233:7-258(-)
MPLCQTCSDKWMPEAFTGQLFHVRNEGGWEYLQTNLITVDSLHHYLLQGLRSLTDAVRHHRETQEEESVQDLEECLMRVQPFP